MGESAFLDEVLNRNWEFRIRQNGIPKRLHLLELVPFQPHWVCIRAMSQCLELSSSIYASEECEILAWETSYWARDPHIYTEICMPHLAWLWTLLGNVDTWCEGNRRTMCFVDGWARGASTKDPITGWIRPLISFLCPPTYVIVAASNCVVDIISRPTQPSIAFICSEDSFSYIAGN